MAASDGLFLVATIVVQALILLLIIKAPALLKIDIVNLSLRFIIPPPILARLAALVRPVLLYVLLSIRIVLVVHTISNIRCDGKKKFDETNKKLVCKCRGRK